MIGRRDVEVKPPLRGVFLVVIYFVVFLFALDLVSDVLESGEVICDEIHVEDKQLAYKDQDAKIYEGQGPLDPKEGAGGQLTWGIL